MVYYSEQFEIDLEQIFRGLLTWKKHELEYQHVISYRNDIKKECSTLDLKSHHFNANYLKHKRYGVFVHQYKLNKNTTWYIVYNKDEHRNIFIQRIFSNYTTVTGNQKKK